MKHSTLFTLALLPLVIGMNEINDYQVNLTESKAIIATNDGVELAHYKLVKSKQGLLQFHQIEGTVINKKCDKKTTPKGVWR